MPQPPRSFGNGGGGAGPGCAVGAALSGLTWGVPDTRRVLPAAAYGALSDAAAIWGDDTAHLGGAGVSGVGNPQIGGDSVVKQAGEGKVRAESAEKQTTPSFGFTERGRAASPGCPEERPGVKNGPEAYVEAVRCILMVSRVRKMEIPVKRDPRLFLGSRVVVAGESATRNVLPLDGT